MPLIPLLPLFHRFNREYFDGLLATGSKSLVSVRWSDGRLTNTAGFYRRVFHNYLVSEAEIVLSTPLLANLPLSAVESTLCHEMIHAWTDLVLGIKEGHGKVFKEKMAFINSLQNNFHVTIRHQYPIPSKTPKWLAICPLCGSRVLCRRRFKRAACKKCCDKKYNGNWHANCILVYEPVPQTV